MSLMESLTQSGLYIPIFVVVISAGFYFAGLKEMGAASLIGGFIGYFFSSFSLRKKRLDRIN